jgi:hypothetical protein
VKDFFCVLMRVNWVSQIDPTRGIDFAGLDAPSKPCESYAKTQVVLTESTLARRKILMAHRIMHFVLAGFVVSIVSLPSAARSMPDDSLKVVIIRHGEKPETGDHLSCQGENRARQLSAVLYNKFNKPNYTYVPSLSPGTSTGHARMFQTVAPLAIKYNLTVNSKFEEKNYKDVAAEVQKKTGTVLLVWEHSVIPPLAKRLGVENPPAWKDSDFDSIWIITYFRGSASLSVDKEGLNPSPDCGS